jgi:hypothetical protein
MYRWCTTETSPSRVDDRGIEDQGLLQVKSTPRQHKVSVNISRKAEAERERERELGHPSKISSCFNQASPGFFGQHPLRRGHDCFDFHHVSSLPLVTTTHARSREIVDEEDWLSRTAPMGNKQQTGEDPQTVNATPPFALIQKVGEKD